MAKQKRVPKEGVFNPVMPYPQLAGLIRLMARDNGLFEKPSKEWKWPDPDEAEMLENQASRLADDYEMEVFAIGEHTEHNKLVSKRRLKELSQFLNDVFDGDLHENFFSKETAKTHPAVKRMYKKAGLKDVD